MRYNENKNQVINKFIEFSLRNRLIVLLIAAGMTVYEKTSYVRVNTSNKYTLRLPTDPVIRDRKLRQFG
ncbi:hypothetical protein [Terrimonas pollutisoli]|uniref:hypothetical protein n=1 Tax=Terrimonas pollutisoli TaxID=3034147 RepID=UPI0023ECB425|nr:hypothetical protein [Terrimonas sp. H1YJ31]